MTAALREAQRSPARPSGCRCRQDDRALPHSAGYVEPVLGVIPDQPLEPHEHEVAGG